MHPKLPSTVLTGQVLSPLDDRYHEQTEGLLPFLSQGALNRARVFVEIQWLLFSVDSGIFPHVPAFTRAQIDYLESIPDSFDSADITRLSELENQTRHDVKAVEYFIREKLVQSDESLGGYQELVHIFCTSEDINNLAYALCVKNAVTQVWLPQAQALIEKLQQMADRYADLPMLARTHGQPATPTTLGKELAVFAHRLTRQINQVSQTQYLGKFNGATGTFSAHTVALPEVNWPYTSDAFVKHLGLIPNPLTTQIESHDWQAELYSRISHFNRISHNLATDCWTYISMGYFHQELSAHGSTGSSTMPHKVNPIRFENAEANLELSCALLDALSQTLTTSRLQRDLTDSSTQRNIGSALGYSLVALSNLLRGLDSVSANETLISADLQSRWEVLSEAIQQVLRLEVAAGNTQLGSPYEELKKLTRGREVTEGQLRDFIGSLAISDQVKAQLLALTPSTYIGEAPKLATS